MKRAFVGLLTFCLILKPHAAVYFHLAPPSAVETTSQSALSEPEEISTPIQSDLDAYRNCVIQRDFDAEKNHAREHNEKIMVFQVVEPSGSIRHFKLPPDQTATAFRLSFKNPVIMEAHALSMLGLISADESKRIIDLEVRKQFPMPTDKGKTFVASLTVGKTISHDERVALDREVKEVLKLNFSGKSVLRFSENSPPLSEQTSDKNLEARAMQAYRLLAEAAVKYAQKNSSSNEAMQIRKARWYNALDDSNGKWANPRVVFLTGRDRHPALFFKGKENAHLIGSSGKFPGKEVQNEAPFGSHYVTLTLVESAIPVLGVQKGMAFLSAWIAHETMVLKERVYVAPTPEEEKLLNEGYRQILKEWKTKPSAYARLNAEKRKLIDRIVLRNAVAREILAKVCLQETDSSAAEKELKGLGLDRVTAEQWICSAASKTPLPRATLKTLDAKGAQLLAASL